MPFECLRLCMPSPSPLHAFAFACICMRYTLGVVWCKPNIFFKIPSPVKFNSSNSLHLFQNPLPSHILIYFPLDNGLPTILAVHQRPSREQIGWFTICSVFVGLHRSIGGTWYGNVVRTIDLLGKKSTVRSF